MIKDSAENDGRKLGWLSLVLIIAAEFFRKMIGLTTRFLAHPSEPPLQTEKPSVSVREHDVPGRSADASLRSGTALVTLFSLISFLAGISFVFNFWTGGPNWRLGTSLGIFFASLGASLIFYTHRLTQYREAIEQREELRSNEEQRETAVEDYCAGLHDIKRRKLLKWLVVGAMTMMGAIVVSVFRAFGVDPSPSLYDTVWHRGQRLVTIDGVPISLEALEPGSMVVVFPEDKIGSEKAQTVLIRVKEEFLQLPPERSDWAPRGYLAYSRVCTHAGCPVSMFETTTNLLLCPCHQSTFNVLRAAKPTGGPAARPLPQLPLFADAEGMLRAGGGFSEPPGPGFWGLP
jgi:ubiquinol-cytochrome c reductase iron-sulfur subunit